VRQLTRVVCGMLDPGLDCEQEYRNDKRATATALFPDLSCASARSRARAIAMLPDYASGDCASGAEQTRFKLQFHGPLVLAAVVSRRDWSALVREAALRSASNLPWSSDSTALLRPALRDSSPQVRVAAYTALATAPAFDTVCAALALETHTAVRQAAFRAIQLMAVKDDVDAVASDKLLVALGKGAPVESMKAALAVGEYVGVLADGLEDSYSSTRLQAMQAVAAFYPPSFGNTTSCEQPPLRLFTCIASLAAETLSRDQNRLVRREALKVLANAVPGMSANASCVHALAREVRRGGENSSLALRALTRSPVQGLASFSAAVGCIEAEIVRARDSARRSVDCGSSEATDRVVESENALKGLVVRNIGFARVADLVRQPSDKLSLFL
jgi:hypothetical protein